MSHDFFFGYGSLVNRGTHGFAEAQTARLRGWKRMWRKTALREVAYLTAVPDDSTEIDGLIAAVPQGDWAALDLREKAYERRDAAHQIDLPQAPETTRPRIAVYAIAPGAHHPPDPESPVLLSYIDVVVQGYLREFGAEGVARFFDTTDGWEAPVLNDRGAPRYPRHCVLSVEEREMVDAHLADKRVRLLKA
ncbi:gamma-glutamylcyclotransferase family protein [Roseovarius aestuariivivens]|uniref:gamma-glutamylcyclotransferase family protein n=1 Tax=Roseovarius aestuariivivens TaxID=1888910 RepID=UPI001080EA6D|nr:gamma-glutamylcyclotransferase family protein [Roseovarius aestuariivivens]